MTDTRRPATPAAATPAAGSRAVTVSPRTDDWDELTELAEDLSGYTDNRAAVYNAIQAVAEGRSATLDIAAARVDEFVAHMREFRIDAQVAT